MKSAIVTFSDIENAMREQTLMFHVSTKSVGNHSVQIRNCAVIYYYRKSTLHHIKTRIRNNVCYAVYVEPRRVGLGLGLLFAIEHLLRSAANSVNGKITKAIERIQHES